MTILHPPATPTSQLTFMSDMRAWVGEISSTHGFGRVYDDACDEGMTLVSARTGTEVVYVIDHEERASDGEVTAIVLVPAGPHQQSKVTTSLGRVIRVRLFND